MVDIDISQRLMVLADKYETEGFLVGDPSCFMHRVNGVANQEVTAFVAAALSYGSRKQFMPKIQCMLDWADGDMYGWIRNRAYMRCFADNDATFYRLYNNHMMRNFLDAMQCMLEMYESLGNFVEETVVRQMPGRFGAIDAMRILTAWFVDHGSMGVVPRNTSSACKRLAMFLRWMVRDGSPVDLGLWSQMIDKRSLIVPMDTHVVQEAVGFGLINSKTVSMSAALRLTDILREIWPEDPLRGDFALFGLGVDQ